MSEPIDAAGGEARPFWQGLAEGRLVLPRCASCDVLVWHPRDFCPLCWGTQLSWEELSGHGVVYSHTEVRRGGMRPGGAPYVVAYVELDEGPRILANVEVDVELDGSEGLTIGDEVRADVGKGDDGTALLRFVRNARKKVVEKRLPGS